MGPGPPAGRPGTGHSSARQPDRTGIGDRCPVGVDPIGRRSVDGGRGDRRHRRPMGVQDHPPDPVDASAGTVDDGPRRLGDGCPTTGAGRGRSPSPEQRTTVGVVRSNGEHPGVPHHRTSPGQRARPDFRARIAEHPPVPRRPWFRRQRARRRHRARVARIPVRPGRPHRCARGTLPGGSGFQPVAPGRTRSRLGLGDGVAGRRFRASHRRVAFALGTAGHWPADGRRGHPAVRRRPSRSADGDGRPGYRGAGRDEPIHRHVHRTRRGARRPRHRIVGGQPDRSHGLRRHDASGRTGSGSDPAPGGLGGSPTNRVR